MLRDNSAEAAHYSSLYKNNRFFFSSKQSCSGLIIASFNHFFIWWNIKLCAASIVIIILMMNHHVVLYGIQRRISHPKDLKKISCKVTLKEGWSWNYCTSVYKQPSYRKHYLQLPAAKRWENSDERADEETLVFSSTPEPRKFNVQKTSWVMEAEFIPQSRKTGNTGGGFPAKKLQPYSMITSLPSVTLLPGGLHACKEVLWQMWQSTFCFYNPFFFHLLSTKLASFSSSLPNPSLYFCPEIKNAGEKKAENIKQTKQCLVTLSSFLSFSCVFSPAWRPQAHNGPRPRARATTGPNKQAQGTWSISQLHDAQAMEGHSKSLGFPSARNSSHPPKKRAGAGGSGRGKGWGRDGAAAGPEGRWCRQQQACF